MKTKYAWWEWLGAIVLVLILVAFAVLFMWAGLYLGDWLMEKHTIGGVVVACTIFLWMCGRGKIVTKIERKDR